MVNIGNKLLFEISFHAHRPTRTRIVCMCVFVTYATEKVINQKYYDDACKDGDNNLVNTNTNTKK